MTHAPDRAPYFLDCDTGIDDALAIVYLLGAGANLVGIASVSGNTTAQQAARNTESLLTLAGRSDIPVAEGAHDPQVGRYAGGSPTVHGDNGVGGLNLPHATGNVTTTTGPELLIAAAEQHHGALRVIATGPLTNLAAALRQYPNLPQLIRHITVMGGAAAVPGNVTPAAEANIHVDPESAADVFAADWNITLVPLDVTMTQVLTEPDRQRLADADAPAVRAVADMLEFYFAYYFTAYGQDSCAMHDPLAAAIALQRIPITFAPLATITVDTSDGPTRGRTICHFDGPPVNSGAQCNVVLKVGPGAVDEVLSQTLSLDTDCTA